MSDSFSEQVGGVSDLKRARQRVSASCDRLPPHDDPAEDGIISCCLQKPDEVLPALAERRFNAAFFYDLRRREIFLAIETLLASGTAVDTVTLCEHLNGAGKLEQIGGIGYVTQICDCAPSAANWPAYADIVEEKFAQRRLIQTCTEAIQRAYDCEGKVADLLMQAEADIFRLINRWTEKDKSELHIREIVRLVTDDMEHYSRGHGQIRGLTTGLNYLDEKILRGITGEFGYLVLAGRPGDGKTSLAMNIVKHVALHHKWFTAKPTAEGQLPVENAELEWEEHTGLPVGVFSLEMSAKSLGYRLVFGNAEVSQATFQQGFMSTLDQQKLVASAGQLAESNIILDATPRQTMGRIRAKARRWVKQYGIKLFVLDYLQLVKTDSRRYNDKRVDELNDISAEIMALRKELDVPWLVLCQMNRNIEQAESKRVPVLSDLKDCGAIEQDCDVAMFLYRPSRSDKVKEEEEKIEAIAAKNNWHWSATPTRINLFTAKNRNGPTGSADLLFQKNHCVFHDWHVWKVKHGLETMKSGERPKGLGLPSNEEMGIGAEV